MIPRYESEAMRSLFSDDARFAQWTKVEVAACRAFAGRGEISAEEMQAIDQGSTPPTAARVKEIEQETNHDVVAFVRALGENVGEPASRHLHRALTSSDVIDTALGMTLRDALAVLIEATEALAKAVLARAEEHKFTLCAGRTHGIHAEPTTFGLRLLGWYTELCRRHASLKSARELIAVGKLSGAVGNFSQSDPEFEAVVLDELGLRAEPLATQVVPRDRHAEVLSSLALLGGAIERFALEVRNLQRTDVREVEESFGRGQTGSSAMPHKKNPILSERMCGMSRLLRSYAHAAFENIALWHDRDISHSSVERVALVDAFHLAHTMLLKWTELVKNLKVYPERMQHNIDRSGGLLFSQSALGIWLKAGYDRHVAYRLVQRNAMKVWNGEAEQLLEALLGDAEAMKDIDEKALRAVFRAENYTRHVDALFARSTSAYSFS